MASLPPRATAFTTSSTTMRSPLLLSGTPPAVPTPKHACPFVSSSRGKAREVNEYSTSRRDLLIGVGGLCAVGTPMLAAAAPTAAEKTFPKTLDGTVRVTVRRPKKSRSRAEREEEEEVLVVDGIELDRDVFAKFDVYVNDVEDVAAGVGAGRAELAGSFVNVAHRGRKRMRTCLRLGIGDLLEDLGAEDDETVLVSLVPRSGTGLVSVGGVKIELAS